MGELIGTQPNIVVIVVFVVALAVVVASADKLIDHAVVISAQLGVPRIVVGATIISLGTTLPELATAIVAVMQGSTDLAVGNATGSVITNTTLVLGAGALFGAIPVLQETASKLRIFTALMVALIAFSFLDSGLDSFRQGGVLPPWAAVLLLMCVPIYLLLVFRNAARLKTPATRSVDVSHHAEAESKRHSSKVRIILVNLMLLVGFAALLAFGSDAAVSSATTLAHRVGIPEVLIASTIIALGTSLPELVTTVNAARKGHGDLAVGNVLGANILNVTLVLGYTAAFTDGGVHIAQDIFTTHFPVMIAIVAVFSYFVYNTRKHSISHREGWELLSLYAIYLVTLVFL